MEKEKNSTEIRKHSKFYKIAMVFIISILLIGFIIMSLILFDLLKILEDVSRAFIEYISNFLNRLSFEVFL